MRRLVVGVDDSAASVMAVHWASAIAFATGAGIAVVHVVGHKDRGDLQIRGVSAGVERATWMDALDSTGIEHDFRSLYGDPPTRILDLATDVGADMIVIGRRGHAPVGPHLLGSSTQRLLQANQIPVAIVPRPSEQASRTEVTSTAVVGLDDTEPSHAVVDCAISLSDALGLDMDVLTVVDLHGDPSPRRQPAGQSAVESARLALRRLAGSVDPQRRHHIATHTEVGTPADELLRRSRDAKLLIVGHRRRTPMNRFLTQATGRYCAAHAVCPVVLVPIEPVPT